MAFFIKADFSEFKKFAKLSSSSTIGVIKRSIRATVNDQAFSTRMVAIFQEIPRSMLTRGRFNQSLVRVSPARGRSLVSEVGAIKKGNYDGLKNLELGKKESNKAIPHVKEVRGGSRKHKVTKSKQLSNVKFTKVKSRKALSSLSNSGYVGLFKISNKNTKLSPGIYQFKGKGRRNKKGFLERKIIMVRDTQHPTTRAKRNQWLLRSTKKGASAQLTTRFWIRNQERILKKALDRLLK
jgi:hypothetical protein